MDASSLPAGAPAPEAAAVAAPAAPLQLPAPKAAGALVVLDAIPLRADPAPVEAPEVARAEAGADQPSTASEKSAASEPAAAAKPADQKPADHNTAAAPHVHAGPFRATPKKSGALPFLRAHGLKAAALVVATGLGWMTSSSIASRTAAPQVATPAAPAPKAVVADVGAIKPVKAETDATMARLADEIAVLRRRVAAVEAVSGKPAADGEAIKASLAQLGQRIEALRGTQAAALADTTTRIERAQAADAKALAAALERIEKLEKRLADRTPVASIAAAPPPPAGAHPPARPAAAALPSSLPTATPTTPAAARPKYPQLSRTTAPPETTPVAPTAPETRRPPVRGYVLRAVEGGVALVQGYDGLIEVEPGMVLPDAGRVRSIERQNGKWVVVTTRGVIDSRPY